MCIHHTTQQVHRPIHQLHTPVQKCPGEQEFHSSRPCCMRCRKHPGMGVLGLGTIETAVSLLENCPVAAHSPSGLCMRVRQGISEGICIHIQAISFKTPVTLHPHLVFEQSCLDASAQASFKANERILK